MRLLVAILIALVASAPPAGAAVELLNAKTDEPLELKTRKGEEVTPAVTSFLESGENPSVADEAAIEAGGKLYAKRCKACHAADASGKVGPNLVDDEWMYARTPTAVGRFEIIYGGGDASMRGFGRQMDQDEILRVMAYLDALRGGAVEAPEVKKSANAGAAKGSKPPVPFTSAFLGAEDNINAGGEIWGAQCRHCHGAKAYPGKAPKLKPGNYEPDFVYRRVTDGFRKMPAWTDEYSDEERMQVVAYILSSSFSP